MSFFSSSSGRGHYGGMHQGRGYYRREGLFMKLLRLLGVLSSSARGHNRIHSHSSYHNNHFNHGYHRRRHKSSWS
ncbi:hypothetical protein [Clostridium cellulovorans]|uniref:Uncharacterized protein n=1 Tax=Clostridium cellulovorans (strain ATCC 35296 / DSM 3052 / OCM 3 / 743B) TaxID=573061 RepID=D9SPI8_CLOC7|nr:hypothetical protein [Clostridium cellulovorans]ADL50037.1 hypothetical protein Clocel_0253 [Clostridium cellulovorans 743B]